MKQKKQETPKIINEGEDAVPENILAQAIVDIAEAAKRLNNSKLSRRAVQVLIKDYCGVSMHDIGLVLDTAEKLAGYYTKR